MSVSSTEHLDKLAFILYDRPAGRNVIGYAIEKIEQLRAGIERLRSANKQLVEGIASITRNKNEEIERLRAALMEISQYETSAPAGFEWDIVVEELVEIARNALEGKP